MKNFIKNRSYFFMIVVSFSTLFCADQEALLDREILRTDLGKPQSFSDKNLRFKDAQPLINNGTLIYRTYGCIQGVNPNNQNQLCTVFYYQLRTQQCGQETGPIIAIPAKEFLEAVEGQSGDVYSNINEDPTAIEATHSNLKVITPASFCRQLTTVLKVHLPEEVIRRYIL